jgi:hypothetical protein
MVTRSRRKEEDHGQLRTTMAFLDGRLEEASTLEWALKLHPTDSVSREAILNLLRMSAERPIREPYRRAWRLLEESWQESPPAHGLSSEEYQIARRLREGDRSGAVIREIVELVKPILKIEPFSKFHLQYRKPPKKPREVSDLFAVALKSVDPIDPTVLNFEMVGEAGFLEALASDLEAVVVHGLEIARRTGWDGRQSWQLGGLNRVYYVPVGERAAGENEPDQFHSGIAPSVKLLACTVARLAVVEAFAAKRFIARWENSSGPVFRRLWAAFAADASLVSPQEVTQLLLSLDDEQFWNLEEFPEIAELRASRFGDLDTVAQQEIALRLIQGPPRSFWRVRTKYADARKYWAARELRRIEIRGHALPRSASAWLSARQADFPELTAVTRADDGFRQSPKATWVAPNPDTSYDSIVGIERLAALESALSSSRVAWNDNPSQRAADWIRLTGNQIKVISDLETTSDGGAEYFRVWETLTSMRTPMPSAPQFNAEEEMEVTRILALILKLPAGAIESAIDGISQWMMMWAKAIAGLQQGSDVWFKVWPIAARKTNSEQPESEPVNLSTIVKVSDGGEPKDLDALNSAAGRMVEVFLAACPTLTKSEPEPFKSNPQLRNMREAVIGSSGRAKIIVQHRLLWSIEYFLQADSEWARINLLEPLKGSDEGAVALWRAISRSTRFLPVMSIIGAEMADRALDTRLGRQARQSLVFSLVVECLHAFLEERSPVVSLARVQQVLRSIEDEIRAYAASAIKRFVLQVSAHPPEDLGADPGARLFRMVAKPFLYEVWPKERSLVTPGVSRALADLPATSGDAFAEAALAIDRYLVPFDCWAMHDFGFPTEGDKTKLEQINSDEKAEALLNMLDRTVGNADGSVVPYDLGDALARIASVAPPLEGTSIFRRLSASARR